MAKKTIDFGTASALATNNIKWRGIIDDDTLGPGATTTLHVELTRPAADGAFAGGAGLQVWVILLPGIPPPPSIDKGFAGIIGIDSGNQFAAGETKSIDFHITNPPAGGNPANYALVAFIQWDDGVNPPTPFIPSGVPFSLP